MNDQWTFRAGYNHTDNPIGPQDVTFNILAPGVVQNQYTVGATWKLDKVSEITGAFMYAANNSVTGTSLFVAVRRAADDLRNDPDEGVPARGRLQPQVLSKFGLSEFPGGGRDALAAFFLALACRWNWRRRHVRNPTRSPRSQALHVRGEQLGNGYEPLRPVRRAANDDRDDRDEGIPARDRVQP